MMFNTVKGNNIQMNNAGRYTNSANGIIAALMLVRIINNSMNVLYSRCLFEKLSKYCLIFFML